MFKNHLKIAFRHIARNKSYLLINIIGLGLAFACCIVAYVNYQFFNQADTLHKEVDTIFRVTSRTVGGMRPNGQVGAPLMTRAVADLASVKTGVRLEDRGRVVQVGDQLFSEKLTTVDPNFLEVFHFPIVQGNPSALKNPTNIVLTSKMVEKYFGEQNPIGQTITLSPGTDYQREMTVEAVVENPPPNSVLQFDLLTNIAYLASGERKEYLDKWYHRMPTFLVLNKEADTKEVAQQLNQYVPAQNEAFPNWQVTQYGLQPMSLAYKEGITLQNNGLAKMENPVLPTAPGIMALLILLTACLNFTNTTISFSNKRLKEMGVRKVMGSNRKQLVTQLLSESFIICLLALVLGILLAQFLVPQYNQLWAFMNIEFSLNYFEQPDLLIFLGVAVVVAALLGGAYPAFYMSSFQPTSIFRGTTKFGGDNWLVRSLLGLQIVISLLAIIGGVSFVQNANFQKNYDLGYDTKGIIEIPINGEEDFNKLKSAIATHPDILGIAGATNRLGFDNWWSSIGKPEEGRHVQVQNIGEDFLKIMDIAVIEGRPFDKGIESDYEAVLINKKLLEEQQWTSGVGQEIELDDNKKRIVIGVTENFTPSALLYSLSPNVFRFKKPADYRIVKIKVAPENLLTTNAYLKKTWAALFPYIPYESRYQDEVLAFTLTVSQNVSYIFIFLALIAIFLAATGLYSLVSLNFLKRAKEIAIRRVIGASTSNLAFLLNKNYFLIFIVGSLLGGFGGIYLSGFLLETIFKIHQGVHIPSAILAILFVCFIGLLTIGGKLFGVLRTNPAETLKSE